MSLDRAATPDNSEGPIFHKYFAPFPMAKMLELALSKMDIQISDIPGIIAKMKNTLTKDIHKFGLMYEDKTSNPIFPFIVLGSQINSSNTEPSSYNIGFLTLTPISLDNEVYKKHHLEIIRLLNDNGISSESYTFSESLDSIFKMYDVKFKDAKTFFSAIAILVDHDFLPAEVKDMSLDTMKDLFIADTNKVIATYSPKPQDSLKELAKTGGFGGFAAPIAGAAEVKASTVGENYELPTFHA